jgi:hypothetical protein
MTRRGVNLLLHALGDRLPDMTRRLPLPTMRGQRAHLLQRIKSTPQRSA